MLWEEYRQTYQWSWLALTGKLVHPWLRGNQTRTREEGKQQLELVHTQVQVLVPVLVPVLVLVQVPALVEA